MNPPRKQSESGQELIEFAMITPLLLVLLLGSFITGMSLIRSVEVNHICRDLTAMYIHGADFSTYSMQEVAQRLATGLGLQIGGAFPLNEASNIDNGGNALVTVTQIMYVGSTSSPNCVAVGAGNCTNHDSFVFLQRIQFGNGTLNSIKPSTLGYPSTAAISSTGVLQAPVTDGGAKLPSGPQSEMQALWQTSSGGRTPLQDGQVCYVVEVYARSPELSLGMFSSDGVYARYFF
jgi:hypothetical protein